MKYFENLENIQPYDFHKILVGCSCEDMNSSNLCVTMCKYCVEILCSCFIHTDHTHFLYYSHYTESDPEVTEVKIDNQEVLVVCLCLMLLFLFHLI